MKKIAYLLLLFVAVFAFNSCEDDIKSTEDINYIAFEASAVDMGVDIDGTAEHEIKVYTTQKTGSDRSFSIAVIEDASSADPAAYNIPSSVTVPANSNEGSFTVGLSDVNIGDGGETVVIDFVNAEGLYTGNPTTLSITQICPFNEVFINFLFDGYASECTWELLDSSDNVVAEGGPWADGTASAATKLCLQDGTYTFTVYDAYGDGLSYPENGSITISSDGNELGYIEGDFGASESVTFTF